VAFIAIRDAYTADFGNLWAKKKAFASTDSFAMVMVAETDVPAGTALEARFQLVNPRIQAGNWALPRSLPYSVSVNSHAHPFDAFGSDHFHSGITYPDAHAHVGSVSVPVHGATVDLVAGLTVPGPSFAAWYYSDPYSGLVSGLQGSETLNGFFFFRGLLSVGPGDLFDNSIEAWYRVT